MNEELHKMLHHYINMKANIYAMAQGVMAVYRRGEFKYEYKLSHTQHEAIKRIDQLIALEKYKLGKVIR